MQSFNQLLISNAINCNFCTIWNIFGKFYAKTHKFIRAWLNYEYWIAVCVVWLVWGEWGGSVGAGVGGGRREVSVGIAIAVHRRELPAGLPKICGRVYSPCLPPSLSVCVCGCEEHSAGRSRKLWGGEWTVLAGTALSTWTKPQSHFSCGNEM